MYFQDRKKAEKNKEQISIEDLVERERASLGHNTTKVTLTTFLAWKKKKLKEKEAAEKKKTDKKRSDFKSGKEGGISGREMFMFNPALVDVHHDAGADEEGEGATLDMKTLSQDGGDTEEEQVHVSICYIVSVANFAHPVATGHCSVSLKTQKLLRNFTICLDH